jgi:hypothetical protein
LDLIDEAMGKATIEVRGIVMIMRMASVRVAPERIEEIFTMPLSLAQCQNNLLLPFETTYFWPQSPNFRAWCF